MIKFIVHQNGLFSDLDGYLFSEENSKALLDFVDKQIKQKISELNNKHIRIQIEGEGIGNPVGIIQNEINRESIL